MNKALGLGCTAIRRQRFKFKTRKDGHPTVDYLKVFVSTKPTTVDIFNQGQQLRGISESTSDKPRDANTPCGDEWMSAPDLWNSIMLKAYVQAPRKGASWVQ
jgi:hypothetical protein